MKKTLILLAIVLSTLLLLHSGSFASGSGGDDSGQEYIVEKGDSLGRIAEKFYEDPLAYPTIIEGTNKKAEKDHSFKVIHKPDEIQPGWKIWIPAVATLEADDMEGHGVHKIAHWGYQGEGCPVNWGGLDHNYKTCDTGKEQSPISIPSKWKTKAGGLKFDYKPTSLHVLNNGHTIQVNYEEGSSLAIDGHSYELAQFHFHIPSEHTVDGVAATMEMHLVHVDEGGKLAVVGVMFDIGEKDNPFLAAFWDVMPPSGHELNFSSKVNVASAFDIDGKQYRYPGSLTTPPCSEGVKWHVVEKREHLSKAQAAKFVSIIGLNARPTQPLNKRTGK